MQKKRKLITVSMLLNFCWSYECLWAFSLLWKRLNRKHIWLECCAKCDKYLTNFWMKKSVCEQRHSFSNLTKFEKGLPNRGGCSTAQTMIFMSRDKTTAWYMEVTWKLFFFTCVLLCTFKAQSHTNCKLEAFSKCWLHLKEFSF